MISVTIFEIKAIVYSTVHRTVSETLLRIDKSLFQCRYTAVIFKFQRK